MSKAKKVLIALLVIGIALPVALGATYLIWMSSDSDFLSGLFGPSGETPDTLTFVYDSPYQSAKAVTAGDPSPVYVLGADILEDIAPSQALSRLPAGVVRQLYIPSAMRYEGIGMFVCYLDENNRFQIVKTTKSEAVARFDAQKPTVFFIHGMHNDSGALYDEGGSFLTPYLRAGFNVLLFRWSQLSDEAVPWDIEGKIWGTNKGVSKEGTRLLGMRWRKTFEEYVEDDVPNASIAEIFGAFYMDFMTRFDYKGSSIEISGHSMGGQIAFASASFLLTKEQEGLMNPAYLPDKVTLFDPYIPQFFDGAYCAWLKKYVSSYIYDAEGNPAYFAPGVRKYTASVNMMADIAEALNKRGVTTQILPSQTGFVYALASMYSEDGYKKLCENTVTIRYRSDWVKNPIEEFNDFHYAGRDWYVHSIFDEAYPDNAMHNTPDVTPSAMTMLAYIYARTGTSYSMEENTTEDDFTDDIFFADNIETAKIAGFAFDDSNGNGIYDERIQARLAGAKVELYLVDGRKNTLIATKITDESGYYSFDIPRIHANGFDKFYIRVIAPAGYEIGTRGREDGAMGNDIRKTDGLSDTVTLAHYKSLRIINIGLKKAGNE